MVERNGRSGHYQMVDLSPQPQDKSSGAADFHPSPQHDAVPESKSEKTGRSGVWWLISHDGAEAGVQLLSRWAGVVALIAALGAIGWFLTK
ncbi:MAG TPA: hypothetical protein VF442_03740 [Sphingobium sp.]